MENDIKQSYTPTNWSDGQIITANLLNKLENAVQETDSRVSEGIVRYDEIQIIASSQQAQARDNISAAAMNDIEYIVKQNKDNGLAGALSSTEWYLNYRIKCGTISGDVEWVASNGYKCVDYSCSAGDVFIINTSADADEGYCCYAFVDSNSKVIANSGADVVTMSNQRIAAPDDTARLIINGIMSSTDICYIGDYVGTKIQDVDSHVKELEDYIKGMSPMATVTGKIVSVDNAAPLSVEGLTFAVEPVQDLHGYDKPWPAGGGKNLMPCVRTDKTVNGVTFKWNDDGTLVTSGTANASIRYDIFNGNPITLMPGTYIIWGLNDTTVNANGASIQLRKVISSSDTSSLVVKVGGTDSPKTFTVDEQVVVYPVAFISAASLSKAANFTWYPMLCLASETDTAFTPYSNVCPVSGWTGANVTINGATTFITFPSEAGTVYGGTLDVTTGVLTVDRAVVDLGTLSWQVFSASPHDRFGTNDLQGLAVIPPTDSTLADILCSAYQIDTATHVYNHVIAGSIAFGANSRLYCYDPNYSTSADFKAAMSGVQLCYRLISPITYDLTPQEVALLRGSNTVFADTGDTTLTYRQDVATLLSELTVPDETDMTTNINDQKFYITDWTPGQISSTTGEPISSSTDYIAYSKYIYYPKNKYGKVFLKVLNGYRGYIHCYAEDRTFIKDRISFTKSDYFELNDNTYYIRISARPVENKSFNFISASTNIYLEYTTSSVIDTCSALGNMVDTAKTYFDAAYQNNNLVYASTYKGIYGQYVTVQEEGSLYGKNAIVCNSFVNSCLKGTKYEDSRYALGGVVNHEASWAWVSDGTGDYDNFDPTNAVYAYDYMTSNKLAKYADEHGWLHTIDVQYMRNNIQPGDIIFSGANEHTFNGIDHCAIVTNVAHMTKLDGSKTYRVNVMEAFNNTTDYFGNPVGVRFRGTDASKMTIDNWTYYARFPVYNEHYRVEKIHIPTHKNFLIGDPKKIYEETANSLEAGIYTFIINRTMHEDDNYFIYIYYDDVIMETNLVLAMCEGEEFSEITFYSPVSFKWEITRRLNTYDSYVDSIDIYKGIKPTLI